MTGGIVVGIGAVVLAPQRVAVGEVVTRRTPVGRRGGRVSRSTGGLGVTERRTGT